MADLTASEVIELDPNKKGKEYCLKAVKGIWQRYMTGSSVNFYRQKVQWALNEKYAMGRQPINRYKKMLGRDTTINYDHLNFAVTKIMPKIFDILIGMMSRLEFSVQLDAIDPESCDAKLKEQYRSEAEIVLRDIVAVIEKETGQKLSDTTVIYDSVEELAMDVEAGNLKLDFEIASEELVELVFNYNDLGEIIIQVVRDLANCGMGVTRHYVTAGGLIKVRRVDPKRFVSGFVTTRDFREMSQAGEEIYMSIHDLKQVAGNEFTEKQYYEIACHFQSSYGNMSLTSYANVNDCYIPGSGGFIYDKFIVRVFDAEFVTTDRYAHTVNKPNRNGNKETRQKKANYKPSERSEKYTKYTDYKVWYGCKMIIGMDDMCYGWGKIQFPNVEVNRLNESESTFAVHALHIDDMITQTLTERCIEFMDDIVLSFVQMQSYTSKAIPPGIAADSMALSNIPRGKGKTWEPLEMIEYYVKTGNMLTNMMLPNGQFLQRLPIEELRGSDLSNINFWYTKMLNGIDMIKQVMGLNDYTDASNPNPEQSYKGAKLAVEGTQNSLQNMITALDGIVIKTAKGIINRAQKMAQNGELDYLSNAIGRKNLRVLGFSKEISAAVFGMKMAPRMSQEEKNWLEANINAALAKREQTGVGGIELEDAIAIRRYNNIKLAEKMLVYRRKKRQREDEERSANLQKQNAEVQQQSAQTVEQMKQETMKMEMEIYTQKKLEVDLKYRAAEIELENGASLDQIREKGYMQIEVDASKPQPTTSKK